MVMGRLCSVLTLVSDGTAVHMAQLLLVGAERLGGTVGDLSGVALQQECWTRQRRALLDHGDGGGLPAAQVPTVAAGVSRAAAAVVAAVAAVVEA